MGVSRSYSLSNVVLDGPGGKVSLSDYSKSIQESLALIITTRKGERAGMPNYGCDIVDRVFDPNDTLMLGIAKEDVMAAISLYEPRVIVKSVDLVCNDDYEFDVYVDYDEKQDTGVISVDEIV